MYWYTRTEPLIRVTVDLKGINYVLYFRYFIGLNWRNFLCSVKEGSSNQTFVLWRVVRIEMNILVSLCGFPVDAGSDSSIGITGCLGVEKCDRSVRCALYHLGGSVIWFRRCTDCRPLYPVVTNYCGSLALWLKQKVLHGANISGIWKTIEQTSKSLGRF